MTTTDLKANTMKYTTLVLATFIWAASCTPSHPTPEIKVGQVWEMDLSDNDDPFDKPEIHPIEVVAIKGDYVQYMYLEYDKLTRQERLKSDHKRMFSRDYMTLKRQP